MRPQSFLDLEMLTILRICVEVHFFSRPSLESLLDVLKSSDQGKIYLIGTAGGNCSEGVPAACVAWRRFE